MAKDFIPTLKKIVRFAFPVILFSAGLFAMMKAAYAASYLGADWDQFLRGLPNFQGAAQTTGEDLAINFIQNAIGFSKHLRKDYSICLR